MSINVRLFIWLFFAFIIVTVIGTLTHECGHYLVAKSLGYDATLHYGSTNWQPANPNEEVNLDVGIWILVGGPLETMLTGTIGLVLLFYFRKSFVNATKLSLQQWLLIFISLFWLRQTANLAAWIGHYFIGGNISYNNDEIRYSEYLQLPRLTISILSAIIGVVVLTIIIIKFVPAKHRLTFITSGLAGGISGYVVWLILFGKYLMP
jgi:hypothetical protein